MAPSAASPREDFPQGFGAGVVHAIGKPRDTHCAALGAKLLFDLLSERRAVARKGLRRERGETLPELGGRHGLKRGRRTGGRSQNQRLPAIFGQGRELVGEGAPRGPAACRGPAIIDDDEKRLG